MVGISTFYSPFDATAFACMRARDRCIWIARVHLDLLGGHNSDGSNVSAVARKKLIRGAALIHPLIMPYCFTKPIARAIVYLRHNCDANRQFGKGRSCQTSRNTQNLRDGSSPGSSGLWRSTTWDSTGMWWPDSSPTARPRRIGWWTTRAGPVKSPSAPDRDGYLVRGADMAARLRPDMRSRAVVVTGEGVAECPSVWVDDDLLGERAARHLLQYDLASLLSMTDSDARPQFRRHAAFARTVEAAGRDVVTVDEHAYHGARFREEGERELIVAALRDARLPVGIACSDAAIGYRILNAVRAAGLDVPTDALVIACEDDELACLVCRPALSAIDCRGHAVGYEAAALLHRHLDGDTTVDASVHHLVAPGMVVQRASTRPGATQVAAIRKALRFMRERIQRPPAVAEIARHVDLSRRSLERIFRRETGRSPAAEMHSMRMERAAELLLHSPMSVTDVAARCGFVSTAHFNNKFRAQYHCTPTEFASAT